MRLEWSPAARIDRSEAIVSIAEDNYLAAIAIGDAISEHVNHLRDFPEIGKRGRVKGSRELIISGTPYVVAYRIEGDLVRILRLMHSARRWPKRL